MVGVLHQDLLYADPVQVNLVSSLPPVFSQRQHGDHLAPLDDRLLQPGQDRDLL